MKAFPPHTFIFGLINHYYLHSEHYARDALRRIPNTDYVYAHTNQGMVKGTQHYSRGKKVYHFFRGIPYATPPVGKLRFEPPLPHPGWESTFDATRYGSPCWQIPYGTPKELPFGHEDCLFLNVATHSSFRKEELPDAGFRPVIFWIHGGQFMFGSGNFYRPKYFMEEDIVLVTINYRLNSFGFLNTEDEVIQGNMGLKDQTLALKWVQQNIKYFNGDPDRVTVMGQSAGAVSAHLHILTNYSAGLFARAISLSGTALSPWAFINHPGVQAREMSKALNCPTNNSTELAICMKRLPARVIAGYHSEYIIKEISGSRGFFGFTIESNFSNPETVFLSHHPLEIMKHGNISKKPWVNGVTTGDGIVSLIPVVRNDTLLREVNRRWCYYCTKMMFYESHPKKCEISAHAKIIYMDGKTLCRSTLKNASKMITDASWFLNSHKAALLHSKYAPVYSYLYVYEGLFSISDLIMDDVNLPLVPAYHGANIGAGKNLGKSNVLLVKPKHEYGISHGDELALLFNIPVIRMEIDGNDPDLKFSRKLIRLFVSFAETGCSNNTLAKTSSLSSGTIPKLNNYMLPLKRSVPSPSYADENVEWPSIEERNPKLEEKALIRLLLNDTFELVDEPFYERLEFWKKYHIHFMHYM